MKNDSEQSGQSVEWSANLGYCIKQQYYITYY